MINEEFLSDIKTLFDAFRNIGICAALTLGLPYVEQSILSVSNSVWLSHLVTEFYMLIIAIFYLFNLIWLFGTLKEKPKYKALFVVSSIIVISLVTLSICVVAFDQIWNQILIHV